MEHMKRHGLELHKVLGLVGGEFGKMSKKIIEWTKHLSSAGLGVGVVASVMAAATSRMREYVNVMTELNEVHEQTGMANAQINCDGAGNYC
jgi:hypothetical protein